MSGSFRLASERSRFTVRFFNTIASARPDGPAGDALDLLAELRPMRERVNPSTLTSLNTLLQRELSDRRVAHDLVPYLRGEKSPIGFFPAILVALVPSGFLESQGENGDYPTPVTEIADAVVTDYCKHWELTTFKIDGVVTSLGKLAIDPKKTHAIVLDGQHRANAFRYVAGVFKDAVGETPYAPFYENVEIPDNFEAELPVTVIWFETDGPAIHSDLISRQLFVDVNTNAQPVEKSRRILLHDLAISNLTVASLYEELASNTFLPGRLSLLHGAFDVPTDQMPPMSLFSPEIVEHAVRFSALGNDKYFAIDVRVRRDRAEDQENIAVLKAFAPSLTDEKIRLVEQGDRDAIAAVRAELRDEFAAPLVQLFASHPLVAAHLEACDALHQEIENDPEDYFRKTVWHKVFRGGEGLYLGFVDDVAAGGKEYSKYRAAIKSIENRFRDLRAQRAGVERERADKAFRTLATKAAFTAFATAIASLARDHGWNAELFERVKVAAARLSPADWVGALVELKEGMIDGLDPKAWTVLRRLFLRAVEYGSEQVHKEEHRLTVFTREEYRQLAPEYDCIRLKLHSLVALHIKAEGAQKKVIQVGDERKAWLDQAVSSAEQALESAGIPALDGRDSQLAFGRSLLDDFISNHNKKALRSQKEQTGETDGLDFESGDDEAGEME